VPGKEEEKKSFSRKTMGNPNGRHQDTPKGVEEGPLFTKSAMVWRSTRTQSEERELPFKNGLTVDRFQRRGRVALFSKKRPLPREKKH